MFGGSAAPAGCRAGGLLHWLGGWLTGWSSAGGRLALGGAGGLLHWLGGWLTDQLAQAVVLALIQGATEFLPISSSAHLVLPSALTDWPDQGLAFDVAVHLGTLVAVLCYFRRELAGFARSGWTLVARCEPDENLHLLAKIAIATVPLAAAGFAFADLAETRLRAPR